MAEEIVVKELINTMYIGRKVGLPNYSNVECGIHVQFAGDVINDPDQWEANARAAALRGKALMFSELGLPLEIDDQNILREKIETVFPGTTVVTTKESKFGPKAPSKFSSTSPAPSAGGTGRVLGQDEAGRTIKIATGQYGTFVTDGRKDEGGVNVTLRAPTTAENLTLEEAIVMLAAKRG